MVNADLPYPCPNGYDKTISTWYKIKTDRIIMVSHKDHFADTDSARQAARQALLPVVRDQEHHLWDRFVLLMRRILPVFALVAGVATVGWPLLNENEVSFTLSTEDVLRGDDKVRMKALKYRGTDAINRLFTVTAESGFQEDPNAPNVRLSGIRASIQLENAGLALVTARTGQYQKEDARLSLIGGVNLETDNGYSLAMPGADIMLKDRIATGGVVEGQTPLGTLKADRFKVDVAKAVGTFSGRVQLKILPKRTGK